MRHRSRGSGRRTDGAGREAGCGKVLERRALMGSSEKERDPRGGRMSRGRSFQWQVKMLVRAQM